ncbi:MAG: TrmH family RNA methyltransferase [Ghiorsea sp.]
MLNIQLGHAQHQTDVKKYPLCFLVHDMESPTNVGSLFRIADALGVEKLYLSGATPVPPNGKIKKTSRSTEKYVAFEYVKSPLDVVGQLKAKGYTIISLEITSVSMDIRELNLTKNGKICLILGSENVGVNQALLDVSDKTVHIPMLGQNSSMNVASACSIATFELLRNYL